MNNTVNPYILHTAVFCQMYMASIKEFFKKISPYFSVWLLLRLFTSLMAGFFSKSLSIKFSGNLKTIWPIGSDSFWNWFDQAALVPWLRWDAVWYVKLLTKGYAANDGSTSFHPLYIILTKPLYWLGVNPLFSLLITSSIATLGFFWIFYKLACLDLSLEKGMLALILLASFPISIILFAPYTESLFLFFSTLALYQMRQRRWFLASLSTCLACLTRQQGTFLVIPMLVYAWEDSGQSFRLVANAWQGWLAAIMAPAGLFIWTIYRLYYLHEGTINFQSWQEFIYSVLLSSSAKNVFADQAFIWPWNAMAIALPKLENGPDIGDVMTVAIGVGFVVLFIMAWKYMPPAYRLYSLVIILVSFSLSTGPFRIYLSLPRHLLLAIPVFIFLGDSLKKKWQQILMISIQSCLQIFMLFIYVTKSWIP